MALWDKLFKKKDDASSGFKPIVQKNPPPAAPVRVSQARPAAPPPPPPKAKETPKPVEPKKASAPPPPSPPPPKPERETKSRKKGEGGTKGRLRPTDDASFLERGLRRQSEGDHDGAIEDFTKAIELNPNLTKAYAGRGVSREAKGDGGGAKADYSKMLQIEIMGEISRQMRENPDVEV